MGAVLEYLHDARMLHLGDGFRLRQETLPFLGPVGAVRIGRLDGQLVVNPALPVVEEGESDLDLIVVGTPDALTMVEAGADEIPEEIILEAFELAH